MTYKELVASGQADEKLKTEPDEARFWTGSTGDNHGPANAEELAKQDNGKTLEMKLNDAGIDNEAQMQMSEADWNDASERFAGGASGDVKCYKGDTDKNNEPYSDQTKSVYNDCEKGRIEGNHNIDSIKEVDNVNGTEVKGEYTRNTETTNLEDAQGNRFSNESQSKSSESNPAKDTEQSADSGLSDDGGYDYGGYGY